MRASSGHGNPFPENVLGRSLIFSSRDAHRCATRVDGRCSLTQRHEAILAFCVCFMLRFFFRRLQRRYGRWRRRREGPFPRAREGKTRICIGSAQVIVTTVRGPPTLPVQPFASRGVITHPWEGTVWCCPHGGTGSILEIVGVSGIGVVVERPPFRDLQLLLLLPLLLGVKGEGGHSYVRTPCSLLPSGISRPCSSTGGRYPPVAQGCHNLKFGGIVQGHPPLRLQGSKKDRRCIMHTFFTLWRLQPCTR